MKLILSRKGMDSTAGGMSSPILPDGTLLLLPIPYNDNGFRNGWHYDKTELKKSA